MAAINDLISQIQDETLRNRIQEEVSKMAKQKKFGLVFEEHMPESTPLYDMPIKRGCNVMRRDSKDDKSIYVVLRVEGDTAVCVKPEQKDEAVTFDLKDIVRVAEFGESIYPYLKPLDSVCNAPDSDLWHTLIEADNYHALQLLEYLYAGKVDCIYIDPPYNTGAKDWKYNNDYVDGNDAYRHSKWLSFMQRRLKLAKKLLNPADSVLIVTIDEKEYLHLGCLLEEMFPEAQIQMVSITINPSGAIRKNLFSRADEYAFFVILGDAHVVQKKGDGDEVEVRWWYLRRLEYGSRRGTVKGGIAQFYPIYIDNETHKIVKIGKALPHTQDRHSVPDIDGATTVFPIRDDGIEMNWGVTGETLARLLEKKVIQVLPNKKSPYQPYTIKYLSENFEEKIASGRWAVKGYREDGSKIVVETGGKLTRATTVWNEKSYDAKTYGTVLLKNIVGDARFSFPKSLYSVREESNDSDVRYFKPTDEEQSYFHRIYARLISEVQDQHDKTVAPTIAYNKKKIENWVDVQQEQLHVQLTDAQKEVEEYILAEMQATDTLEKKDIRKKAAEAKKKMDKLQHDLPKRRKEIQDEAQAEIDRFNQLQEINPLLLINIVLKF